MKPLGTNVLICNAEEYVKQKGEIHNESSGLTGIAVVTGGRVIPGSSLVKPGGADSTKPGEGIVRAIGDDVKLKITEGCRVLYRSWTGIEVRIAQGDGPWVDHQLTPERDVLAIIDEGERVEVVPRPIPKPQQPGRPG